jgi:hypothetical protein
MSVNVETIENPFPQRLWFLRDIVLGGKNNIPSAVIRRPFEDRPPALDLVEHQLESRIKRLKPSLKKRISDDETVLLPEFPTDAISFTILLKH